MKQTIAVLVLVLVMSAGIPSLIAVAQSETANGLSIDQAIDQALKHSSVIKEARLSLEITKLQLEAAQATAYIPTISFNLTPPSLSQDGFTGDVRGTIGTQVSLPWGTNADLSANVGLGLNLEKAGLDLLSWQVSFSQQLDLSQVTSASKDLEAKETALVGAEWAWKQANENVVVAVAQQFGNLLSERMGQQQAQATLKTAQDQLAKVQAQVDGGQASQSDLLVAQLSLLDAEIKLQQSEQTYAADKASFQREMLGSDQDYDPLPIDLPLDKLQSATSALLARSAIPPEAIANASDVKNAQQAVESAKEQLSSTALDALPSLSLQANVGQDGWKIGFGMAFDLFAPDRAINTTIAQIQLELAQERLSAAREKVRNDILSQRSALQMALQRVQQINLQEKKWSLEETINQSKLDAGLLSIADWDSFQEQENAFYQTGAETKLALVVAYLKYCNSIGVNVNWEDWLR